MDNEEKKPNYINFFENKNLKNGIRINIHTPEGALKAIKEIFTDNKPNFIFGLENQKIEKYEILIIAWREWLISGKMTNIKYQHKELLNKIFKFHFRQEDHVICFQSYNLDEALLMARINKKFLNIIIPKIEGSIPINTSIIATYT
jgi:hypothetical protein